MILGDAGVTGAMGGMLACCKAEGFLTHRSLQQIFSPKLKEDKMELRKRPHSQAIFNEFSRCNCAQLCGEIQW